jgi:hypothetical protein
VASQIFLCFYGVISGAKQVIGAHILENHRQHKTTPVQFLHHSGFVVFLWFSILSLLKITEKRGVESCSVLLMPTTPSPNDNKPRTSHAPSAPSAPSPRRGKLFQCGFGLCPGMGVALETECSMCGIAMHLFCVMKAAVEIKEATQIDVSELSFCSSSCYRLLAEENATLQIVRS